MRALICSTRMPESDRECGSKRVFDLLQCLRGAGWSVTYVAQQADRRDRYAALLRQAGVPAYVGLDTLSERFLTEARFDLAVLAFWHVAERCLPPLRRFSPYTRVIVDSIDVHFLRNARGAFRPGQGSSLVQGLASRFGDEFSRELNAYAAADVVLAVSQKETDLIGDLLADTEVAAWVPLCEELPPSPIPFADRKGILFVGSFWHRPNVDAATYLVEEIAPKIGRQLLREHPIYIVGNATDAHSSRVGSHPSVRVVGWVPSLLPYWNRARVTVVPLRFGAGTKGKLVQSLMAGTPVVSTTFGMEGLDLTPDRDLVVADDPGCFAAGVERLLTDESLWSNVAREGRRRLTVVHGRAAVTARFLDVVDRVLERPSKAALSLQILPGPEDTYSRVRTGMKAAIEATVPVDAAVAVISKGDGQLVELPGRRGEHFPRLEDGRYAGAHPADGPAAVRELERVRGRGTEFLAIPSTAAWWLDHYKEFAAFLKTHGDQVWNDETCRIYRLRATGGARRHLGESTTPAPATHTAGLVTQDPLPRALKQYVRPKRPMIDPSLRLPNDLRSRPAVLAVGIYLVGKPNHAADETGILRDTTAYSVDQRWVALGGDPPGELADVTVKTVIERTPKYAILNDLLAEADLSHYEYLLILDDDVLLPHGFVDALLAVQRNVGFALAQPSRTSDSYLDHPIVEQQRGVLARQTQFVEIGPVISVHRSIFDLLLPFDLTSPMGWGYENVWAYLVQQRGIKMGIIDAVPLSHSLRKSVAHYSWHEADAGRTAYWAKHRHLSMDDCVRVIDVIGFPEAEHV